MLSPSELAAWSLPEAPTHSSTSALRLTTAIHAPKEEVGEKIEGAGKDKLKVPEPKMANPNQQPIAKGKPQLHTPYQ